jgi:hypothetical protein
VATAINNGGGNAVLKADYTANTVLAATTSATPVALTVAASRIVGRKASGSIAAMTGTETVALLPHATNAAEGVATAAQITALEGLQKGLGAVDTVASGACSVSTVVTFLNPAAPATLTLAAGSNGQIKTMVLVAAFATTITGVSGWTGTVSGDYVRAVYSTVAGAWVVLDSRATP